MKKTYQPSSIWFAHEVEEFHPKEFIPTDEVIQVVDFNDEKTKYTVTVLDCDTARVIYFLLEDGYGFIDTLTNGHLLV